MGYDETNGHISAAKTIKGKILYPYRDKGIFVNVFGFRALMPNDHIGIDFLTILNLKIQK